LVDFYIVGHDSFVGSAPKKTVSIAVELRQALAPSLDAR
jgi:hypothetical protein